MINFFQVLLSNSTCASTNRQAQLLRTLAGAINVSGDKLGEHSASIMKASEAGVHFSLT
jgi:hypothetical protein